MTTHVRPLDPSDPAEQNRVLRAAMPPVPIPDEDQERVWQQVLAGIAEPRTRAAARKRRHARTLALAALATVSITGIAAASSDRIARIFGNVTNGTVGDVFQGDAEISEPPKKTTKEMLNRLEAANRGVDLEDAQENPSVVMEPRVLLRDEFDGVEVEIVAYERPAGSPSPVGPREKAETCYSVSTRPDVYGGSVICTPELNPGLPINYGIGSRDSCEISQVTIAGIAANSVEAVRIVTADGVEDALMGDGAFYWHSTTALPERISVERIDGSVVTKPLISQSSLAHRADERRSCPQR